ncbi:hypothetical protein M409DRAFT_58708 [Zasmidium cellare ATCC 36951]|uniref:Uncharacterized protein n=1 Tax=Zasmidium cellare ATCC 36951 TaxID=1080233 RepID=A0A6A6C921_ZASCE|nr:uncharacterized protein M409DRAFT_58708 [Zasmidium cellare ATCC 36951]KAF2161936.1 hypothetical protein M409DRAFT_58708 [Zasmidium cellare ATCC 36951]
MYGSAHPCAGRPASAVLLHLLAFNSARHDTSSRPTLSRHLRRLKDTMAKAFPFFRLSRELRDEIYKEVGGDTIEFNLIPAPKDRDSTAEDENPTMAVKVVGAPTLAPLLVSRDFKHEYEMEVRREMGLVAIGPLESEVQTLALYEDGKADRCLRWCCALLIQMWKPTDSPTVERYDAVLDLLLPYTDNLQMVTYALLDRLPTDGSEQVMPETVLDASAFDERLIKPKNQIKDIRLTSCHYFEGHKLSLPQSMRPLRDVISKYPLLFRWANQIGWPRVRGVIQASDCNVMAYEAVAVRDECGGFVGLDYLIAPCAGFNHEGVMRGVEGVLEERRDRGAGRAS